MIRLLPRTLRGTWLLAGVLWVAACAALWWALPVRPRVVIPGAERLAGFLPDGTSVLVPFLGGMVVRYDADTGRELARFFLDRAQPWTSGVNATVSPDGRLLAWEHIASQPDSVLVWDITADRPLGDVPGSQAAFSLDGRHLVTTEVGKLRHLRVWDMSQNPPTYRMLPQSEVDTTVETAGAAGFSPDGRFLCAAKLTADGRAVISWWRTATWELAGRHVLDKPVELWSITCQARFLPGGRLGAWHDNSSELVSIDPSHGAATTIPWPVTLLYVDIPQGGRYVATGAPTESLWDKLLERATAFGLSVPPRSKFTVFLVDPDTGRECGRIPAEAPLWNAWSRDGRSLATKTASGIALWDIPPRKPWSWFLPLAAILAVPPLWLARRRVRRIYVVAS